MNALNQGIDLSPLRTVEPFSLLKENELNNLIGKAQQKIYRTGKYLAREGKQEEYILFILSGEVKVCRVNKSGKEVIFAKIGPGSCIGEIALLTGNVRTADVIALDKCICLQIERDAFWSHITQYTGLSCFLLKNLADKLRVSSLRLADAAFLDITSQLLKLLRALSVEVELSARKVRVLRQCPSHQSLAAMIGTSREVVTRTLSILEKNGEISRNGKQIFLVG